MIARRVALVFSLLLLPVGYWWYASANPLTANCGSDPTSANCARAQTRAWTGLGIMGAGLVLFAGVVLSRALRARDPKGRPNS